MTTVRPWSYSWRVKKYGYANGIPDINHIIIMFHSVLKLTKILDLKLVCVCDILIT